MTRFARAKGSKASNERTPEEATSWREMKQQLFQKDEELIEEKKRQQAEKRRTENYQAFLNEKEEEERKNVKWAEFPGMVLKTKKKNINKNETIKKKKRVQINDTDKKEKVQISKQDNETSNTTEGGNLKKKKLKNKNVAVDAGKLDTTEQITSTEKESVKVNENVPKIKKLKKVKADGDIKKAKKRKNNTSNDNNKKVKLSNGEENNKKEAQKKDLTEEELKKIAKKNKKKLRQLETKKLYREPINTQTTPLKTKKGRDQNSNKTRKKPQQTTMIYNGKEIEIAYLDGFPIKKEDFLRIRKLRKEMISKGLPRSEINISLKLERRKAEKNLARERKNVCFNCRKSGHNLSECPQLEGQQDAGTGICFKCGSTEHTHFECKVVKGQEFRFAKCFVCNEQGHIARQCPDNARGLYPKGGACKICGDVTHLKKDCPQFQQEQQNENIRFQAETMNVGNPDDFGGKSEINKTHSTLNKIIKF